jgi:hypothetical protein
MGTRARDRRAALRMRASNNPSASRCSALGATSDAAGGRVGGRGCNTSAETMNMDEIMAPAHVAERRSTTIFCLLVGMYVHPRAGGWPPLVVRCNEVLLTRTTSAAPTGATSAQGGRTMRKMRATAPRRAATTAGATPTTSAYGETHAALGWRDVKMETTLIL